MPILERPTFFNDVRNSALKTWELLDANPEVAAPWWQLFKQVNSPRHVLSELLQNAEDAGATWARCNIVDDTFVFEHDGLDFNIDSLGSLCRFGYSNKRNLHTIGFRGIGFKTTFSLGSIVTVQTPSLTFRFSKQRFTLPEWFDADELLPHTRISVRIEDKNYKGAVEENLKEWLSSPVPLLFFNSIQTLEIKGTRVQRTILEDGPVPGSQWVELKADSPTRILKIRHDGLELSQDAIAEIRAERGDDKFTPGAFSVEIVYGLPDSRLYTVLPTQVTPRLPFCCNAPFVQDPSRYRIKDPASSPTNRRILEYIGRMAASTLCTWLGHKELPVESRLQAYELLPVYNANSSNSLDEAVRQIIRREMEGKLTKASIIMGHDGNLYSKSRCADIPAGFVEAWGTETVLSILGKDRTVCVHPQMNDAMRGRLAEWNLLERGETHNFRNALNQAPTLPRPDTDEKLVTLWATIEDLVSNGPNYYTPSFNFPVVPTSGTATLYRVRDLIRMVAKDERLSSEERRLLFGLVKIADRGFLQQFDSPLPNASNQQQKAAMLFRRLNFETSSIQRVFDMACETVFTESPNQETCVMLTTIAVKADLNIRNASFRYVCRDGKWRAPREGLIVPRSRYENLFPYEWMQQRCVSNCYSEALDGNYRSTFNRWLESENSGLSEFPPPQLVKKDIWGHQKVRELIQERNGTAPDFMGATHTWCFTFHDYDWDDALIEYWTACQNDDSETWSRIVAASAKTWAPITDKVIRARIDRPRGAARYEISCGLTASWLFRLQSLACIKDEKHGKPVLPYNLLLRTEATEGLQDIELFVNRDVDKPYARPLLDALGVRSKPKNAKKIMERLRALARDTNPPLTILSDTYRALDRVFSNLDMFERSNIWSEFNRDALIFDNEGQWQREPFVFLSNDDDFPGIPVVHRELLSLSLWTKLGVASKPSPESGINWLKSLPSRAELSASDIRRISAVLRQLPHKALQATEHWLSSAGTWVPMADLKYYVTGKRTDTRCDAKLFNQVRNRVADLSVLLPEYLESFTSTLLPLAEALSSELETEASQECAVPTWVLEIAIGLLRVTSPKSLRNVSDAEAVLSKDRQKAVELHGSGFCKAERLVVKPMLNNTQAGTDTDVRALWHKSKIYVVGSEPTHHGELVEQLVSRFLTEEFRQAITHCLDRSVEWIRDYFAETFELRSLDEALRDLGLATAVVSGQPSNPPEQLPVVASTVVDIEREIQSELQPETTHVDQEAWEDIDVSESSHSESSTAREGGYRPVARRQPLAEYLSQQGFYYNEARRLYERYTDGAVVRKEPGFDFWTRYDQHGEEAGYLFEIRSIGSDSIVLPADVWDFLELRPSESTLVAMHPAGHPISIEMENLLTWRRADQISVSAATYRINFKESEVLLGS